MSLYSRFHAYNATRQSQTVPPGSQQEEDELFARVPEIRTPHGWLVDLVNQFGSRNGFHILSDRFNAGYNLHIPVIATLIRPFVLCREVLTPHTISKYFTPIAVRFVIDHKA